MPVYLVKDPQTGQSVKLTGDSPPTEQELNDIFSSLPRVQAQPQVSAQNIDVPAGGAGPAFPERPAQPERTFGETLTGLGEAALTTATGATGGALGFLAGSVEGIAKELTGQIPSGEGAKIAQQRASDLTFAPRSEAGQEFVGDIGETLGALPPTGLTGGVIPKISVPSIQLPKSRNKILNALGEVAPENIPKSFKKLGEDRFEPRIFGMVKEARKQGFDDSVTTMITNSTPNTKRGLLKQVSLIERVKGDARAKALEGVSDIAGDALVRKIDFVEGNKNQAGKQLGRVAKRLKGKDVDVKTPVNKFISDLDELGVTFDDKGKPIFEGSQIEGVAPAESLINKIALRIKRNPNPDALEAHQFKKFIDENVAFGKSAAEGLSGKTESVVKSLRSGVNDSISDISKDYKQANKQFSDNINVLNELQDVAGRKLDFKGPNADKAAGVLLRSQLNNTGKRANLLTVIGKLEDVSKKYGGSFDDDILTLSIMADELESVFGSRTRTAIRNEAKKGASDAIIDVSGMTVLGAAGLAAKKLNKVRKGVNEKNQLKAIKRLIRGK